MTAPIPDRAATFRTFADVVGGVERPRCDDESHDAPAVAALSHDGCTGLPAFGCADCTAMIRAHIERNIRERIPTVCVDCGAQLPAKRWRLNPI